MKLPDVELSELRYFYSVARAGSFAAGARRAHVSAPAVSKAIKKLEESLGAELFDRSGRKVSLTPAGEVLLVHVMTVLESLEQLGSAVASADDTLRGEVSVGTSEEFAAHALPLALVRLASDHPSLLVRTYLMGPEEMGRRLLDGDLDVGLTTARTDVPDSLRVSSLIESPMSVVCGRAHPLFGRPDVQPAALSGFPFVVPQFFGQQTPADGYPADAQPRVVGASAELVQMAIQMAVEGAFLGYFPDVMIRCQLNHRELWRLPGPAAAAVELLAVRRPLAAHRAAVDALLDQLRVALAETLDLECTI